LKKRPPEDRGLLSALQSGRRGCHRPDCLVDPHSREGLGGRRIHRRHRHRDLPTWPFRALILLGMAVAAIEFLVRAADLRSARATQEQEVRMSPFEIGLLAIAGLLVLIYLGMPIGIGMLTVSFLGVAAIRNDVVSFG
jgi:type VI protein secretion system component VasF